jgi:hypothetical protein
VAVGTVVGGAVEEAAMPMVTVVEVVVKEEGGEATEGAMIAVTGTKIGP